MEALLEKIKHRFEIWKIEKYTKRRAFMPEYDSKDKEYYDKYYHDGVYYSDDTIPPPSSKTADRGNSALKALHRAPSLATKRASTLLRRQTRQHKSTMPAPRCSETYNATLHQ